MAQLVIRLAAFQRLTLLFVVLAATVSGQGEARRATNMAALRAFPAFYHLRPVVIVGQVVTKQNGDMELTDSAGSVRLVADGSAPDGVDEIRGAFWDLGRMRRDDPQLAAYDLWRTFRVDPFGPWPRPGEVTVIVATAVAPASAPLTPSIRAIVLNPARYLDQRVTITGQYSGRNLIGDLPDAPAMSRYDFVLRSADAAIWVANTPPRGKNFELGLDARVDTARWLQVSGTVKQGRGLQWIDADAGSLTLAKAPAETVAEEIDVPIRLPATPPPEVLFSVPAEDESDVSLTTTVRIQLSRDLDPATLKGHVQVAYLESSIERGAPTPPKVDFTVQYNVASRVLQLRFTRPLERFRTLKVQLLEGILGTDKQPLRPWVLTFMLGGS